jgi:hypothetical protein
MTKSEIATLLERVAAWPEEAHSELAQSIVDIEAKYTGVYRLSDEERASIERGLQDLRSGRLVSDEDMSAFWKQHGA